MRKRIDWIVTDTGCWECTSHYRTGNGYAQFWKDGRLTRVTRHLWEECFGDIPSRMGVCHHCDNPSCINPEHLFIGTQGDNIQDAVKKGRQNLNTRPKLTREQVGSFKNNPYPVKNWIRSFGVAKRTLYDILEKKTWRDVMVEEAKPGE
jgi:hypothetical protein